MSDTDRLIVVVTSILADMEEDRLCAACLTDTCEVHTEMPDTGIGCGDGADLAKRLIEAGVTLTPDPAPALVTAIDKALHELGVPNDGYPAPVANAVDILRAALGGSTP